ncbi:MAG: hypothetical protein NC429_16985 [Lachnospiraceae bacterium]|nr:hypothetical protein [Lachnospiraceae bacterium]
MAVTGVENRISTYNIAYKGIYGDSKSNVEKSSSVSFAESVNKAAGKESVVDEYKRKHPKEAGTVDGQVNSGKAVLKKNGADKVSREDMTMEEYKQFFTKLMNGIPFDSSQQMDVEIWNISEKGWEQMKNDPEYEAWVLGYTAQDRAVHIPFASMPGYSANLHTEQFGASIEEHLGQSVPMNSSGSKASSASDEEDWWEKRHKKLEEFLEQQEKKAVERRASAQSRNQQAQLLQMQMQMMQNAGYQQLASGYMGGGVPASLAGAFLQTGAAGMFYGF